MDPRKQNNGLQPRTEVTWTIKNRSKDTLRKMFRQSQLATVDRTVPAANMDQEIGVRCDFSLFATSESHGAIKTTKTHTPTIKKGIVDDMVPNTRNTEDGHLHDAGTSASKFIAKASHGVGAAMHEMQSDIWTHLKSGVYREFLSHLYLNEQLGDSGMGTKMAVEERNGGMELDDFRHFEPVMSYGNNNSSSGNSNNWRNDYNYGMQDTSTRDGNDDVNDLNSGNIMGPQYSLPRADDIFSSPTPTPTDFVNTGEEELKETCENGERNWASQNKRPKFLELEQYNPKAFKRMKKLGTGLLGTVYKAKERVSGDRMTVALKVQKKSDIAMADMSEQIGREMRLHRILNHENVVELYGSFEDSTHIYLALEFMAGGDLFDKQRKKRAGRFEEAEASRYIGDVARGLSYCHSKGVIHRDVKPENLLLDASGTVKLADFGWSTDEEVSKEYCGTLDYMSREIITESPYGTDVDCFSLGICAFEFLTGHPAFERQGENECEYKNKTMQRIVGGEYKWPANLDISKDAKHLVDGLLQLEVADRFTMSDVLNHRWIHKYAVQKNTPQ